ncbi:glycoprotein 3-alpha-L-fucosyltransferase A-like isoform X2 [Patiria miniata]|uniref:Fucosyltransferase n=1 Tax=Patiria miniata TaxID=46514 RepID=A0A914A338_PATMI|nr:glycoprotein 3-alpha-L-fucosyltransferase A-like isoform X2 [Patiria miniata]
MSATNLLSLRKAVHQTEDQNMSFRRLYIGVTTRRLSIQCFIASVFGSLIVLFLFNELSSDKLHHLQLRAWNFARNRLNVQDRGIKANMGPDENKAWNSRPQAAPSKHFAILAEMDVISKWSELEEMYRCFLDPSDNSTRPCNVFCPEHSTTIELIITKNVKDFSGTDAAIFGLSPFTLLKSVTKLMKYSIQIPPTQTAVLYSMESPLRVHKWIHRVGDLKYHVDLTYLPSADISVPYAYYQPGSFENTFERKANYAEGKTGLIAWMGSNCAKEVFWPRMEFIEELGRHLPLDTYGKCGKLTCLPRLSTKCVNLIGTYKFYLALENSECRDYITEKFWVSCLLNGVVPVVYGAPKEDFERLAPPNSYIHVSDFKSVEELATYILKVDQSDELYNKFFEWRNHGSVLVKYPKMQPSYFCRILPFLQGSRGMSGAKQIRNSKWFNSCRGNITRRFNISQVPTLKDWKPWKLGVNDYKDGF